MLEQLLPLRLAAVGLVLVALLLPLAYMTWRVRRLIVAGYDRDDLVGAIAADLARRREELAFTYGTAPSKLETRLRIVAWAGVACMAAGVAFAGLPWWFLPAAVPPLATATAGSVALLAGVTARARTEHRTAPKALRRLRFWQGPLGGFLFSLAGLGLRKVRGMDSATV